MKTTLESLFFFNILGLSALSSYALGFALRLRTWLSLAIFSWHTAFCLYYWRFTETNRADANNYFETALVGELNWSPGTKFTESFTTLFVSGLGMNKLNTFLVYNMFGVAGLLLLAHVILSHWPFQSGWRRFLPLLMVLMPGLSFWSCAIGKDAPAFFAVCLASYAFLDLQGRKLSFLFAVLVMFLVRPHVAAFMLFAAAVTLLLSKQVSALSRIFMLLAFLAAVSLAMPYVIRYVGLGDGISTQVLGEYVETRQSYNLEGQGAVDIASLPLPAKLFTYLFRPLFFDAPGVLGLVASCENAFFLALFIAFFVRCLFRLLADATASVRYNLIYSVVVLLVFSLTTSNLGIAIRQKTMIMPSIFFLMAYAARKIHDKSQEASHAAVPLVTAGGPVPQR